MQKIAVITGALGNLGRATTQKFTDYGFRVIGLDMPDKVAELGDSPPGVEYRGVDLSSSADTLNTLKQIGEQEGAIHAGVMIAGGFGMGKLLDTSMQEVQDMISLNFETALNATQALWPYMKEGGRFVYMGAKPALEPAAGQNLAAYAFSKSLVFRLAEMVNETGQEEGIRASVMVPSIIDTPPNRESMPDANFEDWVQPEEIGEMIAYLCSEKGRAITTTTVNIYANS